MILLKNDTFSKWYLQWIIFSVNDTFSEWNFRWIIIKLIILSLNDPFNEWYFDDWYFRCEKLLRNDTVDKLKSRAIVPSPFPFCFIFPFFRFHFSPQSRCWSFLLDSLTCSVRNDWRRKRIQQTHRWPFETGKTIGSASSRLPSRNNRKPLEWNVPPVVVVAAVVGARARDATGKLSRVVLTRVVRLDLTSFVRPLKLLDNAFRYLSLASEDFPYNRAVFILQSCYEIRLAEKSAWLL